VVCVCVCVVCVCVLCVCVCVCGVCMCVCVVCVFVCMCVCVVCVFVCMCVCGVCAVCGGRRGEYLSFPNIYRSYIQTLGCMCELEMCDEWFLIRIYPSFGMI